jgi:hypothetical protein
MNVNEIHDENDRENDRQASHNYRIQFALDNLDFRTIEVADPVPLAACRREG